MLGLISIVHVAFRVLDFLILARVLLSWFPVDRYNPVVRFIYEITEPVLAPIRRYTLRGAMPIDFSPFIALLALQFVEWLVVQLLIGLY